MGGTNAEGREAAAAVAAAAAEVAEAVAVAQTAEALSATARARAERNRQKARALREARLVQQPPPTGEAVQSNVCVSSAGPGTGGRAVLSAGGFLIEAEEEAPKRRADPPAPVTHRADQPHCLHCHHPFPHSYLFDTFDYSVCDACRDDSEAHSLMTRTEAMSEFLLKDCDLDKREPPLRCVRRKNPHRARYAEMRLYLRAQVEERAIVVWGSMEELEREREARREKQERTKAAAERRRLRALRMNVRSSLFDRTTAAHTHCYGPETPHDDDTYSRTCAECGHVDTYEKM